MGVIKTPYEISIWELVEGENNNLEEQKIAVIGSNDMTAKCRAINPTLNRKINGETILTFQLYNCYYDELESPNKPMENPFIKYLVNERLIKLKLEKTTGIEWYDFVIDNVQENSEQKSYSYSARSLHIKELGKTGFNIEFNQTLSNNQGTIIELGRRALQGSDWIINTDLPENGGSDILRAYQEDELILLKVTKAGLTAKEMLGNRTIQLAKDSYIMAYHSSWIDTKSELNEIQFLYADNITNLYDGTSGSETAFYSEITKHLDANGLFIDNDNFLISLGKKKRASYFERSASIPLIPGKGQKLSKQKILKYEPLLDKYVNEYSLTEAGVTALNQDGGTYQVGDRINGYTTTETMDTTLVKNIIVNSSDFKDTGGWACFAKNKNDVAGKISVVFNYSMSDIAKERSTGLNKNSTAAQIEKRMTDIKQTSYLKFAVTNTTTINEFTNTAIKSNLSYLKSIEKGRIFILKVKGCLGYGNVTNGLLPGRELSEDVINTNIADFWTSTVKPGPGKWNITSNTWSANNYFAFKIHDYSTNTDLCTFTKIDSANIEGATWRVAPFNEEGYFYYAGVWEKNYSENRMKNNDIKFCFTLPIRGQKQILCIEDIQLFFLERGIPVGEENERILFPGETATNVLKTIPHYYDGNKLSGLKNADEIAYLPTDESYYNILYNDNEYVANWGESLGAYRRHPYERITSIDTKESNRFNIIQQLCESFKCWADFQIKHDNMGRILSRKIAFKEYIGKENYAGFKYGINLKSIQRTIDSEQIATKIIVKANTNQYAPNGFCTIARANENPLMDTFLLDFSYYTKQLLLDEDVLKKDLYTKWKDDFGNNGLYAIIRDWAIRRNEQIDERTAISTTLMHLNSDIKVLEEKIEAATEEYNEAKENYYNLTKLGTSISPVEYPVVPKVYNSTDNPYYKGTPLSDKTWKEIWWTEDKVVEIVTIIEKNWAIIRDDSTEKKELETKKRERDTYQLRYELLTLSIDNYNNQIANEEADFFTKYKNFIREGSWTSSEYIDDNDYYLAAVDVARTSAKPKVSYTINVIDVSPLENYTGYTFSLGDKTFIEDTEFFGWVKKFDPITGAAYDTPYHEEIVLTELVTPLDSPESNQIKVQNYKTQFEDLFQRITATTQSLQYASGGYQRAADMLTESGGMRGKLLQDAIDNNALVLKNANNEHVVTDNQGITLTNTVDQNKVRLTSYGILLSNELDSNGNDVWSAAITGSGINADNITTGSLNAATINITTGGGVNGKAFSWNQYGLNAYNMRNNAVFVNEFIRFDQYGIYHYHGTASGIEYKPSSIADVKALSTNNLSNFYLLRDGTLFVRGHIEAGSGSFAGKITASSGTIGRWNIGDLTSNYTYTLFTTPINVTIEETDYQYVTMLRGTGAIDSVSLGIGRVAVTDEIKQAGQGSTIWDTNWNNKREWIFYVNRRGKLYAQNAEITGKITATSGSFTGNIYASGGTIGDWTIKTSLNEQAVYLKGGTGDTVGSDNSIWLIPQGVLSIARDIGGSDKKKDWRLAIGTNFGVDSAGNLYAKNAHIEGEVTATSGSFKGAVEAKSLKLINGLTIGTVNTSTNTTGFKLTSAGKMTASNISISGTIKATAGEIGGWTIGSDRLSYGTIGTSDSFFLIPQHTLESGISINGSSNSKSWVMTAGANFGVTYTGGLYAKTGKIAGFSLGTNSLYSTRKVRIKCTDATDSISMTSRMGFSSSTFEVPLTMAQFLNPTNLVQEITSLAYRLQINLETGFSLYITDDASTETPIFSIGAAGLFYLGWGDGNPTFFVNCASKRGVLSGTWTLNGSTIATTSDKRNKEEINPLVDKYSMFFDNLLPVTFKYKDGTSDRLHTGFIAQDVRQALEKTQISTQDFAGFVSSDGEDENEENCFYLRYEEFIALNTNEIQKLKRRVAILEEEITRLKRNFYS